MRKTELKPRAAGPGTWAGRLPLLLVVGVTLLAFLPALRGGFVTWDDDWNFLNNFDYRGLGPVQLRWMFTTFLGGPYQPLTWLSFGLDYTLWGMDPARYHLTSLLLHAVNAGLFYALALRLLRSALPRDAEESLLKRGAVFAALSFAVHPLRVESVAWITERRDVLSGAFYLAAVLSYLRACGSGPAPRARLGPALALYCAGLLSKAIGVGLAFVLLALDIYPLRRLQLSPRTWFSPEARPVLAEKLPFLGLGLAAGLVGLFGQQSSAVVLGLEQFGLARRTAQAAYGLVFYVWKTLVPARLLPIYEVPASFDPAAWPFLLCGTAVLAAAGLVYKFRSRWPGLLTAAVVYLAFLAPVLGFVKMGSHFAADRYSYLACCGWAVLAGWALARWLGGGRGARALAAPAAVLLIAVFARLTWQQAQRWESSAALWTYVVPLAPESALALNNLGDVYFKAKRFTESEAAYNKALALRPDYAFISYNLASTLAGQKKWEQAERQYRHTLRIMPAFPAAHGGLGNLLTDLGRYAEAEAEYREAIRLEPANADFHYWLGDAFLYKERLPEAQAEYEQALRLNPRRAAAAANLALTLYKQRKLEQSEHWYLEAIRLAPGLAIAHDNYGNLLQDLNRYAEAAAEYGTALGLDASRPETYNNIGAVLLRQGRAAEAVPYFRRALELKPDMAMAGRGLASALKLKGKTP